LGARHVGGWSTLQKAFEDAQCIRADLNRVKKKPHLLIEKTFSTPIDVNELRESRTVRICKLEVKNASHYPRIES
jgi:hypothetical protein